MAARRGLFEGVPAKHFLVELMGPDMGVECRNGDIPYPAARIDEHVNDHGESPVLRVSPGVPLDAPSCSGSAAVQQWPWARISHARWRKLSFNSLMLPEDRVRAV